MEKYIRVLSTLTTVALILLILIVIAVFIHYHRTKSIADKLLHDNRHSSDIIQPLLSAAFPAGHSFHHITLPYQTANGTVRRAPIDHLLVDRAGVFIIREKNEVGLIDNHCDGTNWSVKNNHGVIEFPDPFKQNIFGMKAVEQLLKQEGIVNIPLYNLVCFTDRRVRFTKTAEKLMTPDHLIPTLQRYNRNQYLSQVDINYALHSIDRFAKPLQPKRPIANGR